MKILVCGKAPCLPDELKDRTLNEFDIVVRVNDWLPIKNRCNRFDAWVFYPGHSHKLDKEKGHDFTPYLKQNPKLWLGHAWAKEECKKVTGKYPDHFLTLEEFNTIQNNAWTYSPTTGIFAIHLAMKLSDDVTIAGFNFYSGTKAYYQNDDTISLAPMHDCIKDKIWVEKQINKGLIKWI